jgi:hypothetical protein
MTAPDLVWLDWREANRYLAAYDEPPLQDVPDCTVAYVRRDPAVLAALPEVQSMVANAVAAERERCAKIAEPPQMHRKGRVGLWRQRRADIAAAIRALIPSPAPIDPATSLEESP